MQKKAIVKTPVPKQVAQSSKPKKAKPTPTKKEINPAASNLKILMIASELAPFIKTGGLADACESLAAALVARGHEVRIFIPRYRSLAVGNATFKQVHGPMGVWMGTGPCNWCTVIETQTISGVTVNCIEFNEYFDRSGLYHAENMDDYQDNPARFAFFVRAALQWCIDTGYSPDIVHAHDWQSALATAYLKVWFWNNPTLAKSASVLTIHNAAYQGVYSKGVYPYLGFGKQHFTSTIFEDYDKVNLLKAGIHFADVVNTVSPTHACEIISPYGGFGLAPLLTEKKNAFYGILNGIDESAWDPRSDKHIPHHFSSHDLSGKKKCKEALQEKFGLSKDPHIAILGVVGRFAEQKGYHLLSKILDKVLGTMHIQFVILGTGAPDLEYFYGGLPARYTHRVGSHIGFSNDLAHLITAGADFFIMPSLFEPCGLNQMYSQRYGTLPIVHATGGLEDTVDNYSEAEGTGSGFKLWDMTPDALYYTIGWAISTYYDRPHHMQKLIANAMAKDFSWEESAEKYLALYNVARDNKQRYDSHCAEKLQ